MKRNVYLTLGYTDKSGKGSIVFSIDPDKNSVGRLVGKLEYSISCRIWVQENSTSFGFAKFTIANNDGIYDWLTDTQLDAYEIADDDNSNYSTRTVQATGLIKKARADGDKNIEITAKDPKEKLKVRVSGAPLPASETSTVSPFPTNTYYGAEGTPKPFLMNFGYSISPILLNRSLNEYQIHDQFAWFMYDVYDNGISVAYTKQADGKFSLTSDPTENGVITVDAIGQQMDSGLDWANFIDEVLIEYFQLIGWTDYDAANVLSLRDKVRYSGGVYRPKPSFYLHPNSNYTANQILQWICDSCSAYNYIDPNGDLIFGYLIRPEDQIIEDGEISNIDAITQLNIFDDLAPKITTKCGATKNWTVLTTEQLAAAVPEEDAAEFTLKWRDTVEAVTTLDPFYKDLGEPQDSLLPGVNQGQDHINDIVEIYSVKRKFYIVQCQTFFNIGQVILVTNKRFGLDVGKKLLVLGYTRDYLNNTLSLILWG